MRRYLFSEELVCYKWSVPWYRSDPKARASAVAQSIALPADNLFKRAVM